MIILFCSDPLNPRLPDSAYGREAAAANRIGIGTSLISYEDLVDDRNASNAVRRITAQSDGDTAVYRGWMMRPDQYAALHAALSNRDVAMFTNPTEYEHCHYLPRWYDRLRGHTPRSVWTNPGDSLTIPHLMELLAPFGDRPVIVKDWVKSRKHEWDAACYIPSASDVTAVARVVSRFLELQGDDLNVGLVAREFVEFEPLSTHSKSGMPLTREFRIFFLRGRPIQVSRYWDEGNYDGSIPPLDHFARLAGEVSSPFFTMDVAKTRAGEWMVVELGDGQVAELPDDADPDAFLLSLVGRDSDDPEL